MMMHSRTRIATTIPASLSEDAARMLGSGRLAATVPGKTPTAVSAGRRPFMGSLPTQGAALVVLATRIRRPARQ